LNLNKSLRNSPVSLKVFPEPADALYREL